MKKITLLIPVFFLTLIFLPAAAQKFEAENATLDGGAVEKADSTASGNYYVEQKSGSLTFDIAIDEEAFYDIYIQAAAPSGNKTNIFSVDGANIEFKLLQNDTLKRFKVISSLKLLAGSHTVKILNSWGYINIDYIIFETVDPATRFETNTTLVTPNPGDHAAKLYQFLLDNYGKKIISGAMTLNSMDEINWLKLRTGKEPALVGLDFMQCGRNYGWYNDNEPINDARNYYNKNGIPAFCWHWRDPSRKTEAFYTKDTDFDVSKISNENSEEYKAIVKDIDYIASLLLKLQNDGVPILWRPLHEASGGWFWWGAKGAEPCKILYRLIYDRMVNYHGLKNLIWVWTSQQNDISWYPGDEYVDIIGRDIYKEGDHGSQILEFNKLNDDYGRKKLVTLSECGSFPDADNLVNESAAWSYFMPWYGDFVRDSKYNSLDLWKKMFAHKYVLTLDEMPDLKSYTTPENSSWRSVLYPDNWKPGFTDGQGRFLHDFSYAGYHQGKKQIPFIDNNIVDVTLPPYNADTSGVNDVTASIQQALNDVGESGGGVVYLPSGTYKVNPGNGETALRIRYNNTILRGAGVDSTFIFNSTSNMRQKNIIWMMGDWCTWSNPNGTTSKLTLDLLYPTQIIPVKSVAGFNKGDHIILRTDGTPEFIDEHGMAGIWTSSVTQVMFLRQIDSIDVDNNLIYIDSPTRYFMKTRDNARIYHAKDHIIECGIENLSIGNQQSIKTGWDEETYSTTGTGAYEVHASHAIYLKYAQNCWVTNVNTYKPENNTGDFHVLSNCLILNQCRGITVDSCFFQKSQYEGGGGNGYMFTLSSNDCLIKNSRANHSRHNYDFKFPYSNGNVIHNCIGENSKYSSDFHMYLSMSNLFDVTTIDKDYLESTFRPYGGSVIHGYSSTQSVFYNTNGKAYHSNKDYIIESRQFGYGYIIGTSGDANKVKLDPVQGTIGSYNYNTTPRDFAEGIGEGEGLMPQSLYLDQLQRRLQDSTGLPTYKVTINTKHSFTDVPLANCEVRIFNKQVNTDIYGNAVFEKTNSLLIINVEKNGFYPLLNKQLIIFSDTTLNFSLVPEKYDVTIVAHDQSNGNIFEGTPIIFNGETQVTNSNGEVQFQAYKGNFDYQINKTSFINLSGTVQVESDTTFHFFLTRSSAYIKFRLKEGTIPVNKATVILNNDTLISTGLGITNFKNLAVFEDYNYLIYKGGYNDIIGSFQLINDTTIDIQMDAYKTPILSFEENVMLKIWPNPVIDLLNIQFPNYIFNGIIEIWSAQGNLIRSIPLETVGLYQLKTGNLESGVYLLHIISAEKQINKMFLKQN